MTYNVTNGTATVSWLPNPGAVSSYTVGMNGTNYTVAAGEDSLTEPVVDTPLGYDYGDPSAYTEFDVQANYAGGSSPQSSTFLEANYPDEVKIIDGPQGSAYLAASPATLPLGTTAFRITRSDQYAEANFANSAYDTNWDIPVSSLTNGLCLIPAYMQTSPVDGYGQSNYVWWVQTVASGTPNSLANWAGNYSDDADPFYDYPQNINWMVAPFFDGREQLKQNLIFLLRAGLNNQTFQFAEVFTNGLGQIIYATPTNYAFASYYEFNNIPGYLPTAGVGVFLPFGENYRYENFVFNLSKVDGGGLLTAFSDIYNHGYGLYLDEPPTYQFQPLVVNGTYIAPVLATNQTRWLFSYPAYPGYTFMSPIGITTTGSTNQLATNARNSFGLQFLSTEIAWGTNSSQTLTLYPGNYTTQSGWFYSETAQPQFQTVEYDFWNPPYWPYNNTNIMSALPGMPGFSITNKSQSWLIASVGEQNYRVAGYAKLSVQNGYSGVYGYLGQYFTNAYEINTNGAVTTNSAGILSPYGDFFPTNPGPAALITMPDIDTGAQGTCTVYCVSLAVDKNHDGVMDISFGGADATSQSSPMNFWVNDNYDRYKYDADDNTNYQDDLGNADVAYLPSAQQVPDCQYTTNGLPAIPDTRDLEDYARLWTPGMAAAMKALPANDYVQLVLSGDAQLRIFKAYESNGGTNYLFDETTASNQVRNSTSLYMGLLDSSAPLILGVGTNVSEHYIFCGAQAGSAQVDLQVLDNNGNVLADSTAYLQINDIKQMYERWTVGEEPSVAPKTTAIPAVDGVMTAFEYTPPTGTNTPYILFVHGWNMETWEKDRFAETAFKRLYWQGYQGRFGSYRWPTYYGFGGLWSALTDPRNYDNSESNAWQSAAGLLNLLDNLKAEYPGHVYMLAHSMGNVVAGEALRLAGNDQVVNTYVASQAAVPAHDYDSTVTSPYLLQFTYTYPTPPLSYLGSRNYGPDTPNIYGGWFTGNYGGGAKQIISFYNVNDYALAMPAWGFDQITKPDGSYLYTGSINDPSPWNKFGLVLEDGATNMFDIVNNLNDRYEVMAYAAEPRSTALGATPSVLNLNRNVDLTRTSPSSIWPSDPTENNYREHFWHSAEFEGDYPQQQGYWSELLSSEAFGLK